MDADEVCVRLGQFVMEKGMDCFEGANAVVKFVVVMASHRSLGHHASPRVPRAMPRSAAKSARE